MQSRFVSLAVVLAVLVAASSGCTRKEEPRPAPPTDAPATVAKAAQVKRGGYLVGIGGCNDCHTPMKFDPALGMPVPQMDRLLSGHPEGAPDPSGEPGKADQAVIGPTFTSFKLPFGTVYTANLTPDAETGLGLWSEADFVRAVRTGKHRGAEAGRPILPPMPWMNVAQASDEDLAAIFAYLQSIPAIKNAVPEPKVPPPVIAAIQTGYDKLAAQQKAATTNKLQPNRGGGAFRGVRRQASGENDRGRDAEA